MSFEVGVVVITTAVFFALRISEVITWSYLWVFSPVWIYAIIALFSFIYISLNE